MEIKIGPYILSQRTPYSKIRLLDSKTKEDITSGNEEILSEIIKEYEAQNRNPENYFNVKGTSLVSLNDFVTKNKTKYIFVPDYITEIEDSAFAKSTIELIALPDSVEKIARCAFSNCKNLKAIDIPKSVKDIAMFAFAECRRLSSVVLPDIEKIKEGTFEYCTALKDVYVPDTVKIIKEGAFRNCNNLENITLSKNLGYIEMRAFRDCESLKEINIPDSVKKIAERAFMGCVNLKSVKLPFNLENLESETFANCKNLENIVIPDGVSTLEYNIFSRTEKLENINIPKSLRHIEASAFKLSSIKSLTFNYNLDEIEFDEVFGGLMETLEDTNIDKIIIEKNVETITPRIFGSLSDKIKELEYHGTKKEFETFKKNNKELFEKCLINVTKVNCLEEKMKDKEIER